MPHQLTTDVAWFPESHEIDDRRIHTAMYQIDAPDGQILVDAGGIDDLEAGADTIESTDISTVLLTHTSYPHTRDVPMLHQSETRVVTAAGIPDEFGMSYGEMWKLGEAATGTTTIEGRTFDFIKSPLTDHVYSLWIYDHTDAVLFTAEALGNYHTAGSETATWTDPSDIDTDQITAFCRDRLPWLQYSDPASIRSTLTARIAPYDIEWIAPSHGNPVAGSCLDAYVDAFIETAEKLADTWQPPANVSDTAKNA